MHIAADMQLVVAEIKNSKEERYNYVKSCLLREEDRQKAFQSDLHRARIIWQGLKPKRKRKKRK